MKMFSKFNASLTPFALLFLFALQIFGTARGDDRKNGFIVKYRSVDRIYLDGGTREGLNPGTTLGLYKADSLTAEVEVGYASATSASCSILSGDQSLHEGDTLSVITWAEAPESAPESDTVRADLAPGPALVEKPISSAKRKRLSGQMTGSVGLQLYSWQDQSASNLDFSQHTLRINVRARRINGGSWSAVLRTRGQYDQRNRDYSTGAQGNEFVNRVYEASLAHANPDSRWEFMFGRILPRRISRLGYIDGASVDLHLGNGWHTGILGGARPQWQYLEQQVSLQKVGTYLGYENLESTDFRVEQYVAFAGEYHGSSISREMLHLYGNLTLGSRWSQYHQVDLDINRSWRKEKSHQGITLSNVYFSSRYRFSHHISVGFSYDSRQNYWTYELLSTVDSLFDTETRRGVRGHLNLRLPANVVLNSQMGYRKGSNDTTGTTSFSIYASRSNIIGRGSNVSSRVSSFSGPNSKGTTYNLRADMQFMNRIYPGLSYGAYDYETVSTASSRRNLWWEGELRIELPIRAYVQSRYRKQWGDDLKGYTLQFEIGKRF